MCEDCHLSCESCSGEEKNQCTKCAKGLSLTYVDNDYLRLCLYALRPAKFHIFMVAYPALLQRWCLLFLPLQGRFLTAQQTCVSKCPGGFFASRLSAVCEACPPGCLQCVDAQHCIRCQSTRKAQLFLQDGQCVQECVRWGVNCLFVFVSQILINLDSIYIQGTWECSSSIWKLIALSLEIRC